MTWITKRLETLRSRLLFVPVMFLAAGIGLSQATLFVDRRLSDNALPRILETTVASADSILSTIAGGLISAITLLLSLVLVSVQLASSQFSPRTVRDWIGDRTQQRTIGIVLGTTVYCLMVLRETQTVNERIALAPHISVLLAVALAIISLVAVVRSVDHLSNSMRVGSVAQNLARDTVAAVERQDGLQAAANPRAAPATAIMNPKPDRAESTPVSVSSGGWVQSIDVDALLKALPEKANLVVAAATGTFVLPGQPVAWVEPGLDDATRVRVLNAGFEIGDARRVNSDVSYGLLQMSDIALRALSPGINDPNTAGDVIVHIGLVLVALWERPPIASEYEHEGRSVAMTPITHADYLAAAYAQILRYSSSEHDVLATLIRSLNTLKEEAKRRDLPGPIEPIDAMLVEIRDTISRAGFSKADENRLVALTEEVFA